MTTYERKNAKTPNGGDYSEIYYFNDKNESVPKEKASKAVIRECKEDGTLIHETFGNVQTAKR